MAVGSLILGQRSLRGHQGVPKGRPAALNWFRQAASSRHSVAEKACVTLRAHEK